MIDNFELIKRLFYFNKANNMFMHCQIVQRAKDHKGNKVKEGAIKTYFIRSSEHLEKLREEIIHLCNHYKARAYINTAGKDFSTLQSLMLMKLASDVHLGNIRNPQKVLNSAAGELKSRRPRWVIDIDDISLSEPVLKWLDDYFLVTEASVLGDREAIYLEARVPTVQGEHLIVPPFNLKLFQDTFPDIDVHKNSMGTVLYIPNNINSKNVCSECGSTNVQVQGWVRANTKEYVDDITDYSEGWCEDCEKHVKLKEV